MGCRILEVFYRNQELAAEVVGVEVRFEVPLIDQETGGVLDRPLVGTLSLLARSAEGQFAVVDVKTTAQRYIALQVAAASPGGRPRTPAATRTGPRSSRRRIPGTRCSRLPNP
ncbi:MAG: hypothetical protein ACE5JD_05630 [Candidatus Methylomirabilia bacterium]